MDTLQALHTASNACARYENERGGADVWQTPAELAASGVGDCEDFAIAYWHALRHHHGYARVACCWHTDRQAHMVCLYYPPGETDPLVLDVVADAVCRLSERPDLVVVLEMDDAGVYVRGVRKPVSTIRPWGEVLERMRG